MDVTYQPNIQDRLFLARRLAPRQLAYWLPSLLFLPLIVQLGYSLSTGRHGSGWGMTALLLTLNAVTLLVFLLLPWVIKRWVMWRARRMVEETMTFCVTPEGLVWQIEANGEAAEYCVEWPQVRDIELDREYLLFWISSSKAIALPRRIWAEPEQVFSFHDRAAAWRRAAQLRRAAWQAGLFASGGRAGS